MAKRKYRRVPRFTSVVLNNKLYNETEKLLTRASKRLERLSRGIDVNKGTYNPKTKRYERKGTITIINESGKRVKIKQKNIQSFSNTSWAGKKLNEKLNQIGKVNLKTLKLDKEVKMSDLKAINKAVKNFLSSQTSTLKGIRKIEKTTKDSMRELLSDIDNISNEDINTLYEFFNDPDYQFARDYLDPSELNIVLAESKSSKDTTEEFINRISNYIDEESLYRDEDLYNKLVNIYNKFK